MYKSNAQQCLYRLCDELLGEDWYIVDPVGGNQGNEIIVGEILKKYKRVPFLRRYKPKHLK